MNIILINPPAHRQVEEYDLATWQHLGIGRLSGYIQQFGHKVTLIDAKLQRLKIHQIFKIIENKKPDLVGLTSMTPDIYNAYSVARGIKDINQRITIVIGGCHATVMPEVTLKEEPCLDYLVIGEGERTFKELLDAVENNASSKLLQEINGLAFRRGVEIIRTNTRPWDTHLEELPVPDWQLYHYAAQYKLETSRGCPFNCVHCMRVLGGKTRYFPVKNVLSEFKNIMQLKNNLLMEIVDETFTLNERRLHELLDGMIELGVGEKIKWQCSTRANLVNRSLLEKMKKAGCYMVCFGVESGNAEILKRIKKDVKLEEVVNAIRLARELKVQSFASFILGHPSEKLEDMIETINFAVRANPHIASMGTMVPYPGTEVREIAEKGGGNYRLLSKNWTEYGRQFSYVLELKDVSKRDMDKLQLIGLLKIYIYNWRIYDLIKFILQYWREGFLLLKMIFSKRSENISPSRISLFQLVRIFFSKC